MEEKYILNLKNLIIDSLKDLNGDLALGFSGGIDSVVIAKLLIDLKIKFNSYVVSTEKSLDLESARRVSKELGIKLQEIIITQKDIEDAIPIQAKILVDLYKKEGKEILKPKPLAVGYNLPLYFLFKNIKEKNVILAQGPDAMLGGYRRYLKTEFKDRMHEDTIEALNKDLIQNSATATHFNKKCIFPYMTDEIIEFCQKLPENMKINNGERKYLLRQLGLNLGLSKQTASRDKKACQYGSGIMREIERLTRKKGMNVKNYLIE